MKKLSIISSLVLGMLFLTTQVNAQGLFWSAQAGYAGGFSTLSMDNVTITADKSTYETQKISLGKGINVGASIGTMFNDNFGAELGINYLLGGKTTITYNDEAFGSKSENEYKATMLRIMPTFIVRANPNDITPYAKLGLIVGTGSFTDKSTTESDFGGTMSTSVMNEKYSGGLALGLNASLGVMFEMSKKMSFFAELQNMNMSYSPTKSVVDEATIDGTDQLDNMTTSQKEWEYSKKVEEDNTAPADPSKPSTSTFFSFPFGSLGINVGIVMNL